MQNDFLAEEKLTTEGETKKTRFRSYSIGGAEQTTELCTLVWFLNAVSSPSLNDDLSGVQLKYIKKIKDRKHV